MFDLENEQSENKFQHSLNSISKNLFISIQGLPLSYIASKLIFFKCILNFKTPITTMSSCKMLHRIYKCSQFC